MSLKKTESTPIRYLWLFGPPAIVVLVLAQQFGEVPGNHLFTKVLQNALHIPWFAALTLVVWFILGPHRFVWVLVFVSAIGVGTEALQIVGPRDASLIDLELNPLGASIAALGIVLHRQYSGFRRKQFVGWVGVIGFLALVTLALPAYIQLSYQHRDRMFPPTPGNR